MISRSEIKQEYFELIKKLNQSNKHKNQVTNVYFYIVSTNTNHLKLFAAISDSQKIMLCHKIGKSKWRESQFSQYPNLEEFIAYLLPDCSDRDNLTKYLKSHIFKLTS